MPCKAVISVIIFRVFVGGRGSYDLVGFFFVRRNSSVSARTTFICYSTVSLYILKVVEMTKYRPYLIKCHKRSRKLPPII